MKKYSLFAAIILLGGAIISCDFDRNKPGLSYFPDMEKSQAFETYSDNKVFSDGKTNLLPSANTIARGKMPSHFVKTEENLALAGVELKNPLIKDEKVLLAGKRLYDTYCLVCHGDKGDGKGSLFVSGKYPFPPASFLTDKSRSRPEGELYHIISVGIGVMGAHETLLNPDERWEIVSYIKQLK